MVYSIWLFGFSVLFLITERLWPEKPQPVWRKGFLQDALYLVFYGEYLGVLLGVLASYGIAALDQALETTHLRGIFYLGAMAGQPLWMQIPVLVLVLDFAQWVIHNLFHRVGFLWEFHKLHHSIEEMDWLGNWRFHWVEVIVYRSLLYVPAAFFGFSPAAMFWFGVLNTLVGHFAHANLRVRIGPLRYLINSPEMHRWHHAYPNAGGAHLNFGITLSVWDWLFRTAYIPDGKGPGRLGFVGIAAYPQTIFGRMVAPFRR